MILKYIIALLLLLPVQVFADDGVLDWYQSEDVTIFYVRQDGSATKDNAISAASASTSMSVATFNGVTFDPGDTVYFSSRGGDITADVIVPSSGTSGDPITYEGEPGYIPTLTSSEYFRVGSTTLSISNVVVKNLIRYSVGGTSGFEFGGDGTGIVTYGLDVERMGNQGFQHLDTVTVEHHDLISRVCGDEGVSLHDSPTVAIYGATITGSTNGFNWVGTPTLQVYDFSITGISNIAGHSIDGRLATGGDVSFHRGYIEENTGQTGQVIDCTQGAWAFDNVIFRNLTDGDYYLLAQSTLDSFKLVNCTFAGDGVNSTTAVYNNFAGIYKNNIFVDTITEAFYGTTGTIDHNLYYNSGTARGTNTVTGDPDLYVANSFLKSTSIAIAAGIGPSSDSDIPVYDFHNETRSGTTTDIGADLYSALSDGEPDPPPTEDPVVRTFDFTAETAADPWTNANWAIRPRTGATDTVRIYSGTPNHVLPSSGDDLFLYWDADTFADKQFSTVVIHSATGAFNDHSGPAVRVQAAEYSGYYLSIRSATILRIYQMTAGTPTLLLAITSGFTLAPGDAVTLTADGAVLSAFVNGVQVGTSVTDTGTTYLTGDVGIIWDMVAIGYRTWEGGEW